MNNTCLFELESLKNILIINNGLGQESMEKFRSTILKKSQDEADALGKQLLETISKKGYGDNVESVNQLIMDGANPNYKNEKKGDFPLLVCARKGYIKTFYLLLRAGADVNLANNYFTTTLMASARHGNKEMVRVLIALDADINARCLDGDNAIMSAKRHNQKECFDILVKAQAHLTNRNLANQSLIDIPGDVSFDFSCLEDDSSIVIPKTTMADAKGLLDEAYQKLKKITKDV